MFFDECFPLHMSLSENVFVYCTHVYAGGGKGRGVGGEGKRVRLS